MTQGESPHYQWRIEAAVELASDNGFEVIWATETTLLLDLDDVQSQETYIANFKSAEVLFGLTEVDRWPSKSGEGIHVVVQCKPMPALARIALQAYLGSDKRREILAVAMFMDGVENPTCLFKPPK